MDSPRRVRVAILNDYDVVVHGLQSMLAPFEDRIEVVELDVRTAVLQDVDVTLFDSFARGWSQTAAIDDVLTHPNAGRVAVFSWNMHPDLIAQALEHGSHGYLDKSSAAEDLVDAVLRIADGEVVVHPAHPPRVEDDPGTAIDWPGRAEGLSPREAEIVALIAQGLTNEDIARINYLSINTVKTYIRNAYRKMGVTRRAQAVRWAMEHHLARDTGRETDPEARADGQDGR